MDVFIKLLVCFIVLCFVMAFVVRVGQRSVVYVAVVAHSHDPDISRVLGVYYKEDQAEARIYQCSKQASTIVYSDVVKCQINAKRR